MHLIYYIDCLFFSIYSGHHSILVPPSEVETNPAVWLTAVSMYKGNQFKTDMSHGIRFPPKWYVQSDESHC